MSIEKITKKDFEKKVLKDEKVVVVKFSADWCHPCKVIEPHLEKLSKIYDGKIKFYEIDVEESSEIVNKFDIVNLPTLLIFKNGRIISSIVGAHPFSYLKKELDEILV